MDGGEMTKRVAAAIMFSIAVSLAALSSPAAAGGRLVQKDALNDVHINAQVDGLSARARKSIDIHRMAVIDDVDSTRLVITVDRLVRTSRFVQKFYIAYETDVPNTYASYVFYAQARHESLIYNQFGGGADDFELCNEVRPRARWAQGKILIDVPHRCVPTQRGTFNVQTSTGRRPGSHRVWSTDDLRFEGRLRS